MPGLCRRRAGDPQPGGSVSSPGLGCAPVGFQEEPAVLLEGTQAHLLPAFVQALFVLDRPRHELSVDLVELGAVELGLAPVGADAVDGGGDQAGAEVASLGSGFHQGDACCQELLVRAVLHEQPEASAGLNPHLLHRGPSPLGEDLLGAGGRPLVEGPELLQDLVVLGVLDPGPAKLLVALSELQELGAELRVGEGRLLLRGIQLLGPGLLPGLCRLHAVPAEENQAAGESHGCETHGDVKSGHHGWAPPVRYLPRQGHQALERFRPKVSGPGQCLVGRYLKESTLRRV